jgi:hypothetical protein
MESSPLRGANDESPMPGHDNVRGAKTYES